MSKERLDKTVALALAVTRSDARDMIKRGRVSVNGSIITDIAYKTDADADIICIDGKSVKAEKFVYIMLNKPKGVVSASRDGKVKTVVDILPESMKRRGLFPAGRLDKDTTGFCLITDDGDFAHNILSPSHHIEKTYVAVLSSPIDGERVSSSFLNGITLADGTVLLSARARLLAPGENPVFEVVIKEGKYHQIKRMFASLGSTVIELKRIKMGGLSLDDALLPGEARYLTKEELLMITEK